MAGEIKASPRNQALGKVADKLARLRDLANKYEILPQVPLLGGTGIGDLLMGQAPEEVSNWSYGNAPMQVPEMTRIPQMKTGRAAPVADALFLGADVGALGGLAAQLGRRGLSEFVGSAGRMAAPGPVPQLGVIKPKGGNWEDLQVQRAVGNLKRPGLNDKGLENLRQRAGQGTLDRYMQENATNYALNSWIDKTLQKYVRNEMATPEDPVRLLAERGITHRPGGTDLNFDEFETLDWISDETEMARQLAGFPKEGMAKSPIAKAWENASDDVIWSRTAGELAGDLYPKAGLGEKTYLEAMPWLSKVDPNTPVYSAGNLGDEYLGFNHLLDELANAKPKDDYLPFVQDFVRSKDWADIGDLENTGLIDIQEPGTLMRKMRNFGLSDVDFIDRFNQAVDRNPQGPRYMNEAELKSFLGLDQPPQNFAQGGLVTQYDPTRIEALVSQLMDEQ